MKNFKITVNGNTYEVGVEEVGGAASVRTVQSAPAPAPKAAPIPKAAPAPAPKAAPAKAAAPVPAGSGDVTAPLNGTVLSIAVSEGEAVKTGQILLIFEAMKMENEIIAPCDGTVKKIHVAKGAVIETGAVVVTLA